MPIISTIGRKQPKMRFVLGLIYTVLTLGAVTMVYPFIVMISTSFTSEVDKDEFRPVPQYFYDDAWLFKKYSESKYNEDLPKYNINFSNDLATFKDLKAPEHPNRQQVDEWLAFKKTLPMTARMLGTAANLSRMTSEMTGRYRAYLQQRYGSLEGVNEAYRETNAIWEDVLMPLEDWSNRSYQPTFTRKYREFLEFKGRQPDRYFWSVSGDGLFQDWLRLRYGAKVEDLNKAWGTQFHSRFDVHLEKRRPRTGSARYREDWETFVRRELPAQFVALDPAAEPLFREYLREKYRDAALLSQRYQAQFASFDAVKLPNPAPIAGIPFADWLEFVERRAPVEAISLRTPEVLYREHLANHYGTLAAMNRAYGGEKQVFRRSGVQAGGTELTAYASSSAPVSEGLNARTPEHLNASADWLSVSPPYLAADWSEMRQDKGAVKREFMARNYREVLNYIVLHGPALWNTFVLCAGLLLVTLVVNPLCAYALSRFNLPSTYKILLFLLATMAFPAEVSAIPNFLLLKQLHLLNTYWALILPAMANGYSIFLLKGFFDSLPKELYEAGQMDGASEPLMFTRITLPMSKPVLAVISLGTFTAAYGSFLWAFLVCQDPKKWTLMVWLSQMQAWAPMFVIFAALVLAAIPTLLVFIFCQNIIMRGIIIPTEK
jgi:multiple sugar transport system permease protein